MGITALAGVEPANVLIDTWWNVNQFIVSQFFLSIKF